MRVGQRRTYAPVQRAPLARACAGGRAAKVRQTGEAGGGRPVLLARLCAAQQGSYESKAKASSMNCWSKMESCILTPQTRTSAMGLLTRVGLRRNNGHAMGLQCWMAA